jgi:hypothetical protein
MADKKISDMTVLSSLDGTEYVPVIKIGDTTNYRTPSLNIPGGSSRVGAQLAFAAGTQPVTFSRTFIATYSLMTDARDSGGNRIDIQILTRDATGFSFYTAIDITLDYRADAAQ